MPFRNDWFQPTDFFALIMPLMNLMPRERKRITVHPKIDHHQTKKVLPWYEGAMAQTAPAQAVEQVSNTRYRAGIGR